MVKLLRATSFEFELRDVGRLAPELIVSRVTGLATLLGAVALILAVLLRDRAQP